MAHNAPLALGFGSLIPGLRQSRRLEFFLALKRRCLRAPIRGGSDVRSVSLRRLVFAHKPSISASFLNFDKRIAIGAMTGHNG